MNRVEHAMTVAAEECSEVAQAALDADIPGLARQAAHIAQTIGKALRFGINDGYPGAGSTNGENLVREVNDLIGALEVMIEEGIPLPGLLDRAAIDAKKARIRHWMGHAAALGTLDAK